MFLDYQMIIINIYIYISILYLFLIMWFWYNALLIKMCINMIFNDEKLVSKWTLLFFYQCHILWYVVITSTSLVFTITCLVVGWENGFYWLHLVVFVSCIESNSRICHKIVEIRFFTIYYFCLFRSDYETRVYYFLKYSFFL